MHARQEERLGAEDIGAKGKRLLGSSSLMFHIIAFLALPHFILASGT